MKKRLTAYVLGTVQKVGYRARVMDFAKMLGLSGTVENLDDGQIRKLYCFTMLLGFSRMRFAEFTLQIDAFTLIQCHWNAFQYFGSSLYTQCPIYESRANVLKFISLNNLKFIPVKD